MAEQVPAVCDVLATIEARNWDGLARLLHPDVHWTTAAEDELRGPDAVIQCLAGDPSSALSYHEMRDGLVRDGSVARGEGVNATREGFPAKVGITSMSA
jgi:hypothetical protein